MDGTARRCRARGQSSLSGPCSTRSSANGGAGGGAYVAFGPLLTVPRAQTCQYANTRAPHSYSGSRNRFPALGDLPRESKNATHPPSAEERGPPSHPLVDTTSLEPEYTDLFAVQDGSPIKPILHCALFDKTIAAFDLSIRRPRKHPQEKSAVPLLPRLTIFLALHAAISNMSFRRSAAVKFVFHGPKVSAP
ncbi:hypothetical protein M885DRAFT_541568 [Pelagophyceae sp. CCMP2097]|nr:hypothetical protein M885DRAFT_541568 [Pelagophyceae sp. CCMP2097]